MQAVLKAPALSSARHFNHAGRVSRTTPTKPMLRFRSFTATMKACRTPKLTPPNTAAAASAALRKILLSFPAWMALEFHEHLLSAVSRRSSLIEVITKIKGGDWKASDVRRFLLERSTMQVSVGEIDLAERWFANVTPGSTGQSSTQVFLRCCEEIERSMTPGC